MITAVITDLRDETRLEATLASLAPAAIDGFIRELLVIGEVADPMALELAEDAGADAVEGADGFASACARARQPWLLILPAGVRLQVGWEDAVRAHARRRPEAAGHFKWATSTPGVGARAVEAAAGARCWVLGRPAAEQGLLVRKAAVAHLAATDSAALARGLGRGRLRGLPARALS
jgi:hypothetical protein